MARKVDRKKLYILIRKLIIVVSVLSLCLGFVLLLESKTYEKDMSQAYIDCMWNFRLGEKWRLDDPYCVWAFDNITTRENLIFKCFFIGVGLPILYFGGEVLLNYIAPEEKDEKR